MFEPKSRGQKYHSVACRKEAWNLRLPVKRVRKDEVRFLDARRRRQAAIPGYVTELRRSKGPTTFRDYVLALRRLRRIEQELSMEALNKALRGAPTLCLPPAPPSPPSDQAGWGPSLGCFSARLWRMLRRILQFPWA
jgi:hypothetical protein